MRTPENLATVTTTGVNNRNFCRGEVAIVGAVRAIGGIKCPVKVVDISVTGFRMECLTYLAVSQVIFLTMPNFQPLEAKIMWQTEWMYGCEFARPLYGAVFEHIVQCYPSVETRPVVSDGLIYGAEAGRQWRQAS